MGPVHSCYLNLWALYASSLHLQGFHGRTTVWNVLYVPKGNSTPAVTPLPTLFWSSALRHIYSPKVKTQETKLQ